MKTTTRTLAQARTGGWAALYLGAAYLLAMPFFLVVVDYPSAVDPIEKVGLLLDHHSTMHAMYLVTYVFFGIALAVLALALYQRLATAAPVVMQVATVVGLVWAAMLVASGMIFNGGMAAVVDRSADDPAGAVTMWQSIEPVAMALGGSGGEILGGIWVLLVTVAGFRDHALPTGLGWLGMTVAITGIASVITPLADAAIAFGLLQIVWFAWLGITLLRSTAPSEGPGHRVVLPRLLVPGRGKQRFGIDGVEPVDPAAAGAPGARPAPSPARPCPPHPPEPPSQDDWAASSPRRS